MMKNNRGSFLLSSLMFTTICLCVLFGGISWALTEILNLRKAAKSALCAKQMTVAAKDYHQRMQNFNEAIFWEYMLKQSKIPKISAAAQIAWEATKTAQQLYHYHFLTSSPQKISHCNTNVKWQALRISSVQTQGSFISRGIDGRAKFKQSSWTIVDMDPENTHLKIPASISFSINHNEKLAWRVFQK